MLVSAANQSHACKALLQATAHGARTKGFCFVGFHVGFQLSGYGGGHHGKGTMGVHVGFHVGFQLSGYEGGHHGKGTMGVHVGFHVGFQLSGYEGGHHGKGTVGVHVGFHVGFQLSRYGGGHHGKGTMGVHVGFHVSFRLSGYGPGAPGGPSRVGSKSSSRCVSRWVHVQANLLPLLGRSPRAVAFASPLGQRGS